MSDGTLFKADRDYSKDVDKLLPEAESLAKVSSSSVDDAEKASITDDYGTRKTLKPPLTSYLVLRSKLDRYTSFHFSCSI